MQHVEWPATTHGTLLNFRTTILCHWLNNFMGFHFGFWIPGYILYFYIEKNLRVLFDSRLHWKCVLPPSFLTRGYAKRRNGFLLGLRYANVSLAHSGVESSWLVGSERTESDAILEHEPHSRVCAVAQWCERVVISNRAMRCLTEGDFKCLQLWPTGRLNFISLWLVQALNVTRIWAFALRPHKLTGGI